MILSFRYLIFAGLDYHPYGGFQDFRRACNDLDEAIKLAIKEPASWWQVVDVFNLKIVACSQCYEHTDDPHYYSSHGNYPGSKQYHSKETH